LRHAAAPPRVHAQVCIGRGAVKSNEDALRALLERPPAVKPRAPTTPGAAPTAAGGAGARWPVVAPPAPAAAGWAAFAPALAPTVDATAAARERDSLAATLAAAQAEVARLRGAIIHGDRALDELVTALETTCDELEAHQAVMRRLLRYRQAADAASSRLARAGAPVPRSSLVGTALATVAAARSGGGDLSAVDPAPILTRVTPILLSKVVAPIGDGGDTVMSSTSEQGAVYPVDRHAVAAATAQRGGESEPAATSPVRTPLFAALPLETRAAGHDGGVGAGGDTGCQGALPQREGATPRPASQERADVHTVAAALRAVIERRYPGIPVAVASLPTVPGGTALHLLVHSLDKADVDAWLPLAQGVLDPEGCVRVTVGVRDDLLQCAPAANPNPLARLECRNLEECNREGVAAAKREGLRRLEADLLRRYDRMVVLSTPRMLASGDLAPWPWVEVYFDERAPAGLAAAGITAATADICGLHESDYAVYSADPDAICTQTCAVGDRLDRGDGYFPVGELDVTGADSDPLLITLTPEPVAKWEKRIRCTTVLGAFVHLKRSPDSDDDTSGVAEAADEWYGITTGHPWVESLCGGGARVNGGLRGVAMNPAAISDADAARALALSYLAPGGRYVADVLPFGLTSKPAACGKPRRASQLSVLEDVSPHAGTLTGEALVANVSNAAARSIISDDHLLAAAADIPLEMDVHERAAASRSKADAFADECMRALQTLCGAAGSTTTDVGGAMAGAGARTPVSPLTHVGYVEVVRVVHQDGAQSSIRQRLFACKPAIPQLGCRGFSGTAVLTHPGAKVLGFMQGRLQLRKKRDGEDTVETLVLVTPLSHAHDQVRQLLSMREGDVLKWCVPAVPRAAGMAASAASDGTT
jgi:hypothetical protein